MTMTSYQWTSSSQGWPLSPGQITSLLPTYQLLITVTRSDDFFDCYPAIQAAFKFTKMVTCKVDLDDDNINEAIEMNKIEFSEFRVFLIILRKYYEYCQVIFTLGLFQMSQLNLKLNSLLIRS